MATVMNLRALKVTTRQLLRDQSQGGQWMDTFEWDEGLMVEAINWACERVCSILGLTYRNGPCAGSSAPSFGSSPVSDRTYATPDLCVDVKDAWIEGGSPMAQRILNPSTVLFEDRRNPRWRITTDPPTTWINVDGNHIMLNGKIPTGYSLMVGYIERPKLMVDDGDFPDTRIQEYYHQHLCYAAAARLLSQAGSRLDAERSDKFFKQFMDLIGAGEADVAQNPVDK